MLAIVTLLATFLNLQETPTPPPTPPPLVTPAPSASPATAPSAAPTPALVASPASIGIAPGEQATVTISGEQGNVSATLSANLVSVTVDQTAHAITMHADAARGVATMHVTDANGASVDVPLRVAPHSAIPPQTATLKVTGNPVDTTWLAQQIAKLVTSLANAVPGLPVDVASPTASPLPVGAQATYSVPVQVQGGDAYLDTNATTNVTVQNVAAPAFAPSILYYDDDPEHILTTGVFYRGNVTAQTPVRLYYYHDSDAASHRVVVVLTNTSLTAPAEVRLIDAPAGPNIDMMSVGHAVSKDYVQYNATGQGMFVDINPQKAYTLRDETFGARQGVAGVTDLQLTSGSGVTLTVASVPVNADAADVAQILNGTAAPRDGHNRSGVFLAANQNDQLTFAAGGQDASIDFGAAGPTPAPGTTGHDAGDYGVLHTLTFTLQNPTAQPATVYLYERPLGGVLRASYLIEGQAAPIDVGCVRDASQRYQIAQFVINPGQPQTIGLRTMTDGGSNFPIEIGATSTAPQLTAPPITAPDGCFPKP